MENKIKVSDYIVKFLEDMGVRHIFLISGGGNIHLIDSIGNSKKIKYICNHHEQASAIAAEAYSRITGNIGVCLVTTGPGGTNAITGVLGAWTDSIPVLVISGQTRTETVGAGKNSLRQLGDQEINIVDIVEPITKYAEMVIDPQDIRYHLEKALYLAKTGRPGPVWLDVPLNIQGAFVDEKKLRVFDPSEVKPKYVTQKNLISNLASKTLSKLKTSKRPVLLVGNGVRIAGASKELLRLIDLLKVPVLASFTGYDLLSSENKYYFGRPGTVGQRSANFILQNSDFLLVLGSRLNIRAIGYNFDTFARAAYKIVVDIDKAELNKKTIKPDLAINTDTKDFIRELINQISNDSFSLKIKPWTKRCKEWNKRFPQVLSEYWKEKKYVNVYCFLEVFSRYLRSSDVLALSDGTACVCEYQTLKFPQGTRIVVNSGCAAMGYGLPASIGACFANNRKSTICIEGDGSLQINIQELQTIKHHNLPIKLFVYNNGGYISIRLTQKNLFNGKWVASGPTSGVTCPDLSKITRAYGFKFVKITSHRGMERKIKKVFSSRGPIICEVMLSPDMEFLPKASSKKLLDGSIVSAPLEDMYPFLSKEELKKNMMIPLVDEL